MDEPASIAVGTPYTRVGASEGYLQSLAEYMAAHPQAKYKVIAGTSYGANRNKLVDWFLHDTNEEWLLQIDDDIRFPTDIVSLLTEEMPDDVRVMVGSVAIGFGQPSNVYSHPEALASRPVTSGQIGARVGKVIGFGGALLLVHRSVFDEMINVFGFGSWFTTWHDRVAMVDSGMVVIRELEPDLSFGRRLTKMGIPAWACFCLPVQHSKPMELTTTEVKKTVRIGNGVKGNEIRIDESAALSARSATK